MDNGAMEDSRRRKAREDIVIIGGGAIGLSCAYQLLKSGRGVTLLEREHIGAGASMGNCGTITPSLLPLPSPQTLRNALRWLAQRDAPLYVKPWPLSRWPWLLSFARHCTDAEFRRILAVKAPLLLRSRELLAEIVRNAPLDCEFDERGHLSVYRDEAQWARAQRLIPLWESAGIATEAWDARAVRAAEPALNDSVVGAHFHPGDASLRPDRYVDALRTAVESLGGIIEEGTSVACLEERAGDEVELVTTHGRRPAREIVLACGAWSPRLARSLALPLPIEPGKGYSITCLRPRLAPQIPLVLRERSVCVTSWGNHLRLGSTMEFSGYDARLNRKRLSALMRAAPEYLDLGGTPQVLQEWWGWRPMTPDDLPIIGRPYRWRNLVLATGHGMLGITLSAITGVLVSEIVNGQPASFDLAPLSPARFR
jgi:D-amino-acid dehydrogenase